MDKFSIAFNKMIASIGLNPDDIEALHSGYRNQDNEIQQLKDKLERSNKLSTERMKQANECVMQVFKSKQTQQELKNKIHRRNMQLKGKDEKIKELKANSINKDDVIWCLAGVERWLHERGFTTGEALARIQITKSKIKTV